MEMITGYVGWYVLFCIVTFIITFTEEVLDVRNSRFGSVRVKDVLKIILGSILPVINVIVLVANLFYLIDRFWEWDYLYKILDYKLIKPKEKK